MAMNSIKCILPARQRGMSLIELMISMLLGLFIVLGIGTLFVQNKQSYRQDEMIARMQEDARYALNTIVDDIELAGFWSNMFNPGGIVVDDEVTIATDCGDGTANWIYDTQQSVVTYDGTTGGAINSIFGCIADHEPSTDAIAIRRVEGSSMEAKGQALEADEVYLRTNGAVGLLFENHAFTPDIPVGGVDVANWRYIPRIYYVRNHAQTEGDGIPTLCAYQLDYSGASPTMTEECIAQGVERFEIEYGMDTGVDGVADRYVSNPTVNQLRANRLVSVRLHLLMRSIDADPTNPNTKTYTIGNLPAYTPDDNFARRVYTTTVLVRNSRNLHCMTTGAC